MLSKNKFSDNHISHLWKFSTLLNFPWFNPTYLLRNVDNYNITLKRFQCSYFCLVFLNPFCVESKYPLSLSFLLSFGFNSYLVPGHIHYFTLFPLWSFFSWLILFWFFRFRCLCRFLISFWSVPTLFF